MRRIVVTKYRQCTHHRNAGRVGRHNDHGLLLVAASVWIGFAHDDVNRAAWVARTRRPPLAAVDDVFIAIALNFALNVGGI